MKDLEEFLEYFERVYNEWGNMPVVGENMRGNWSEVLVNVSVALSDLDKPLRIILEIDEENEL